MSFQTTIAIEQMDKKQRNTSQLLQHASKFGLKRSLTTKVPTSPQIQPRLSVSFSSSPTRSNSMNQPSLQLKEYMPPPPFSTDTGNTGNSPGIFFFCSYLL